MSKQITATLIDSMGTDLTVVNAARVSYGAISQEFSDRDAALVKFLAEHKHITPFRHPKVSIRGYAPIFLMRQLGKHQVGFDWNELSRRYKDGAAIDIDCYMPEVVFERPASLMKQTAKPISKDKQDLAQSILADAYERALDSYADLIELGVAPEQARIVLPQAMQSEWYWTGSLYGWANLYNQRSESGAQYEARLFAQEIDKIMSELFPICWKALTNQG